MSRARHSEKKSSKRAFGGALPELAGGDMPLPAPKPTKNIGLIEGEKAKKRGDRVAKRAAGGAVGLNPFSSAHSGGPKITGAVEKAGSHPVPKGEHGAAVKKALAKGGRC